MVRSEIKHLTLVHSSNNSIEDGGSAQEPEREEIWRQLDLFSDAPETVVYLSPETCELQEVRQLLQNAHIRQIFDMREVPHLTFDDGSRSKFFDLLSQLNISYLSWIAFEAKQQEVPTQEFARELSRQLTGGPTMVFSDREPNDDPEVAKLDENLSREVKGYRSVFVSHLSRQ